MPETPAPPAPDDPAQLGPFLVRGRWGTTPAGTAYQAVAPDGSAVTLVALAPGPSQDAAARDRFAAAVADLGLHGPGAPVAADTAGAWPWVALAAAPGRPAEAEVVRQLLSCVTPAVGVGAVARGPAFAPHWTGQRRLPPPEPQVAPAPESAARRPGRGVGVVVAVVAGLLVLAAVAALLGLRADAPDDPFARPAPSASAPTGPGTPVPTTPGPSGPAAPAPAPSAPAPSSPGAGEPGPGPAEPLQDGPGVSGPSFGAQDETREQRLEGLTFPFRTPATWGCLRSDEATPPAVRWLCLDGRSIGQERPGDPPGGVVHVQPCPAPCGETDWMLLREEHAPDADWRLVDVTTVVHEDVTPGGYRIRMSHLFAAVPGGPIDSHVFVSMTAPPGSEDDVRKVVNDIRANTP